MPFGPNSSILQPDPVLTNVTADSSKQGGWLAPILCAVKPVAKDYVRWKKITAKTLLSTFNSLLRTPGARANLVEQAAYTWATSVVSEDAVRIEYTEEDVQNSMNPMEPRVLAAKKIGNLLMYAQEALVAAKFNPAVIPAGQKDACAAAWNGSSTKIREDVEEFKALFVKLTGIEPNYIRIPRGKLAGILGSDEIQKNPSGLYSEMIRTAEANYGLPTRFMGLTCLIGSGRWDSAPTGAFTPAFVWDSTTLGLNDTVHIGYSPVLNGGTWDGEAPTYLGQFENQQLGTAFAVNEYMSPYFPEDGVHIVHGNVRRSAPEAINADLIVAITGI